jgi:hypothetical protein
MTCYLCTQPISTRQKVEYHHPQYKSSGGTQTAPCHRRCHRNHHSKQGDFKAWGKKGASSKRWVFNLNNVRTHPDYAEARWSYLMNYANPGWSAF